MTIAIMLVASVDTELEKACLRTPSLAHLKGLPKALLPVAGKPMLDHWWGPAITSARRAECSLDMSGPPR